MIRTFSATTEQFLSSLKLSQARSAKAMEELSSGYRVNRPSDSPADVVSILHIQSDVVRTQQTQTNLTRLKNEVDSAETTLQIAVSILDKANVLAAQALGTGQTPESLQALAGQVKDLQSQMLGLSQLNVQGRFVFSGGSDQQAQYVLDPTNASGNGVTRQFTTTESRQIQDVFGTSFTAAVTAEDIFDHRNPDDTLANDNVFQALQKLYDGLTANDKTAIEQSITLVKAASTSANTNLAFYGTVQNRISQSMSIADKYQLQWKTQLSEKRDADPAEAITELESTRTQQSAALGAQANFSPKSLFDYLR